MELLSEEDHKKMRWPFNIAFLGAGGKDPRIDTLSVDSGETRRLLNLPPMNSVYAIDIEDEDGTLVAGTKAGLVYVLASNGSQKTDELVQTPKLVQGAPVLSVCWTSKSALAASDTVRRCLLWQTDHQAPPRPLDTKGETICSLLKSADGLLAGLSSGGKLLFWEPREGRLVRAIDVSTPPPISALVRMVYWPAERVLACPSRRGYLTLFGLEKDDIRDLKAHEGAFYAISMLGERLLTVGMEDGRMKVWEAGSVKATLEFKVVEGVISAAAFSNQHAKVLLVEARGKANTFTLEEDKLRLIGPLFGEDYRTVVVPAQGRIQAVYVQRRNEEVRRIVSEIQLGRVSGDEIDRLHFRLTELGYEQVSLALRGEQAFQRGDIVGALRFYSSLIEILPQDNPKVLDSMERYAALLERTSHMPEADAICRQILRIDPNYRFIVKTHNLSEIAKLVRENDCVIEPYIPLEQVIESATVIRKRFAGRYVINSLESDPCGRVRISPKVIAEKYERVRKESPALNLPMASAEQVWWISQDGYNQIQLVTLGDGATNGIDGLQFALKVSCGDLDTVVTPVVLFDWRHIPPNESSEGGNRRASGALNRIKDKAISNAHLAAVHTVVKQALRRLISENRPQGGMHR